MLSARTVEALWTRSTRTLCFSEWARPMRLANFYIIPLRVSYTVVESILEEQLDSRVPTYE